MAETPRFIRTAVISTRVRLARNFAAYPFPQKMDEAQAEDVVTLVRKGLKPLDLDNFTEYKMSELTEEEAQRLQERYLISPALRGARGGAAFVSSDEHISIMVNEEDHLREQYICHGFRLDEAYERMLGIDSELSATFDFAYSERLGYLTACPSNLGTGLRASVMLFLPVLTKQGKLKSWIAEVKRKGLTVRGAFGEGTVGEGYLYQLSNEKTLGEREMAIIEELKSTALRLCDAESNAREALLQTKGLEIEDRCLRSFGALTNCALLSQKEFLEKMTDIRFGVACGFLEALDEKGFEDFINDMRPAAFRLNNGLEKATETERDAFRAETVCNVLPELVRVARRR